VRITFVCPPPNMHGGVRAIAIYAERLSQRGHEVILVHPPPKPPDLMTMLRTLRRERKLALRAQPQRSHFDGLTVERRILERYRPVRAADLPDADVVLATWWETADWVAPLPPEKGAKAYFLQHYETHSYLPVERVKKTWTLPLHKIVVCQWLEDIAREEFGDTQASLVPYSVDTDQFHAPAREKHAVPTVGMMYSHAPWKGCDITLAAVELARRELPELRLVAFGAVEPDDRLPLPPGTDYRLDPPQNEIAGIYAECDALLFGSRSEGFGLPILEAMACRTPVIGTPTGAAPMMCVNGQGILLDSQAPEAMAEAIVELCRFSRPEWRAMSDAAHAAATSYTWEDATDRFEQALETARNRRW
jgi:glycosyltransferase involved in cell wall biosynthesis